jgi:polar amino acid transport system substrate-binding protein
MRKALAVVVAGVVVGCASAPPAPPDAVRDLAPGGKVRAAINTGNAVLAQKDGATGELKGISVDLARELGKRLGVPVELVHYDAAGKVAGDARNNKWDVAFVAIDPQRATDIDFTAAYVNIEGGYMVPKDSTLKAIEDLDRKGIRIAVGNKSVYDLYLTRTIKNAELVRAPTTPETVPLFLEKKLEAAAGIKAPMARFAATNPNVRLIPGRFMVIEQAMAMPKGREAGVRYLRQFVEDMKASGFVAGGLARSGQGDAEVAPPASQGGKG